ncbi:transposase [Mycolicibacterium aurum]|uniref:Transposase n=1 Tax=Mycolicibacterium aurum TaxID=1791 RepID=A0A3S4RNW5_MYCAU|nr:transposase [Mycolicibacterium aurum]
MESAAPGNLVHVDVKKLSKIPDERRDTAAAFWKRANFWLLQCRFALRNMLTGKGSD